MLSRKNTAALAPSKNGYLHIRAHLKLPRGLAGHSLRATVVLP